MPNLFKKGPLISIIMNCYNGEKYLKQSIISIINQTYKNWELIFFDNCSKDNSLKILNSIKDKRIRVYKSKSYLGLYNARNRAISYAKGKYITFLDVDDIWIKKKLSVQLKYILKHKIIFCFSNFYNFTSKKKWKNIKEKKLKVDTQGLINNYKIGILTVMAKRSIFQKFKFNSRYEIIGDFDFFVNLSFKIKLYYLPISLAFYRIHDLNLSKKYSLYIKEFINWINTNKKKNKFKKINFFKLYVYIFKLKIKKILDLKNSF